MKTAKFTGWVSVCFCAMSLAQAAQPAQSQSPQANGIVFSNEPICSAAHKLAALSGKQLYCPSDIKGTVEFTYNDANPTAEKYDRLLKMILDHEGFGVLATGVEGLYVVERQREIKDANIPVYHHVNNVPDDYGTYTVVIPLKYYVAESVSRMMRNFMPPNTRIIADEANNQLIITDRGAHIHSLAELIVALDTPRSAASSRQQVAEWKKMHALELLHPRPAPSPAAKPEQHEAH